jgi:hypothetical protein
LLDPISKKKTITKKGCGMAQGVDPEFKPQCCKRKEESERKESMFAAQQPW